MSIVHASPNVSRRNPIARGKDPRCSGRAGLIRYIHKEFLGGLCLGHRLAQTWGYAPRDWKSRRSEEIITSKQELFLADLARKYPLLTDELLLAINACTGERTFYEWETVSVGEARFAIATLIAAERTRQSEPKP